MQGMSVDLLSVKDRIDCIRQSMDAILSEYRQGKNPPIFTLRDQALELCRSQNLLREQLQYDRKQEHVARVRERGKKALFELEKAKEDVAAVQKEAEDKITEANGKVWSAHTKHDRPCEELSAALVEQGHLKQAVRFADSMKAETTSAAASSGSPPVALDPTKPVVELLDALEQMPAQSTWPPGLAAMVQHARLSLRDQVAARLSDRLPMVSPALCETEMPESKLRDDPWQYTLCCTCHKPRSDNPWIQWMHCANPECRHWLHDTCLFQNGLCVHCSYGPDDAISTVEVPALAAHCRLCAEVAAAAPAAANSQPTAPQHEQSIETGALDRAQGFAAQRVPTEIEMSTKRAGVGFVLSASAERPQVCRSQSCTTCRSHTIRPGAGHYSTGPAVVAFTSAVINDIFNEADAATDPSHRIARSDSLQNTK